MSKSLVYPYGRWEERAGAIQKIGKRYATKEKISLLSAQPFLDEGQEVDADRIFDGWYIEKEYKRFHLHVNQDGSDFWVSIHENDGSLLQRTMRFASAADAADAARKVVDLMN